MDIPAFERITGVTLDAMFSMDQHIDVNLTAKEALECKLINRVVALTPELSNEITAHKTSITALYSQHKIAAKTEPNNQQPVTMTADQIKTQFPEAYKSIYAKGKAKGVGTSAITIFFIPVTTFFPGTNFTLLVLK